jgi:hypothetical protein
MPHDVGEETSRLRLLRELQRLAGEPAPRVEVRESPDVEVSRNVEGRSLDDVRAEFREAWQAKVAAQRQRAAWARKRAVALQHTTRQLRIAGLLMGALVGLLFGIGSHHLLRLLHGAFLGAVFGLLAVSPLLLLTEGSAGHWREHAEQLERAAQKLEQL